MVTKIIDSSAAELLGKLGQASTAKTDKIAEIINRHSVIAAGAGWIPIPFVDMAVIIGNVWKMYASINTVIGVSFTANMMKSIGSGVVGIAGNVGVAAYGVVANLSSAVVSASLLSILKLIPGLGTVSAGLMLTAGNYATCTAAGWVYLKALATIAGEDGIIDPSDPDMKKKLKRAAKSQKEESRKLKDEIQKKYIIQNNEDKKNK